MLKLTQTQIDFFASLAEDTSVTYSAEDNKLRIYCNSRMDKEDYQVLRDMGFVYAPKQDITGVAVWSPSREDFCNLISGNDITAEQNTVIERAEAKAERLEALAEKRQMQAGLFMQAADRIASNIPLGQPILIGHHSEKKALRDQKRIESSIDKAHQAAGAVNYWNMRAMSVERHANRRADFGVRSRRIETLLKDMRKQQSYINEGYANINRWEEISKIEDNEERQKLACYLSGYTGMAPANTWRKTEDGELTGDEVIEIGIKYNKARTINRNTLRWIVHLLNRLNFERNELGLVHSYDQKLTGVIIQTFLRKQGADKPKAKLNKESGKWEINSDVPLPLHISNEKKITLTDEEVIALMMNCGYEVPAPKAKAPSALNFKANAIMVKFKFASEPVQIRQIEMTKAEYSALYKDDKGMVLSSCGTFKVRYALDPHSTVAYFHRERVCVVLTDSKIHPAPESQAVISTPALEDKAA